MSDILSYTDISSGYRYIKDGGKYDSYFPKPDRQDNILIFDGDVTDTVELMKRVVWTYINDTKRIAPVLKRPTVKDTCQAIWEFVYTYVQYKFDKKGLEQLRRPARSWAEKRTGVDCDCMSIFISSILTNLRIPHSFRIAKYSRPQWQHVYVVVPAGNGSGHYAIDAVVSKFNYEKPFTAKKDFTMDINGIDVAVLSGYDSEEDALTEVLFGLDFPDDDDDDELGALTDEQQLEAIYKHLVATRKAVAQNPHLVTGVDDPQGFLKMLDYAIQYWNTDKRDEALDNLSRFEEQMNARNGFAGVDDDDYEDLDELGFLKPKKLFKNIGKAVKKAGKAIAKGAKAVGKGVAKVAKKVVKAVVRFNPLTISARAGFLLAMRLNMKKMASKIKWAYATQEQAAQKGISAAQWQKAKDSLAKVEKLFVSKLQGKSSALRKAVLKGKAGNLNGIVEYVEDYSEFDGLGIAPAAALAAAVPIIKAVLDIFKKNGQIAEGEDMSTDNLSEELDTSSDAVMYELESEDTEFKQVPNTPTVTAVPMAEKTSFGEKLANTMQKVATVTQAASSVLAPIVSKTPAVTQPQATTPVQAQPVAVVPYAAEAAPAPASSTGGGIMNFIKANPIPSLLIAGVGAFAIYKLVSPKKKAKSSGGLSGTSSRKRKKTTKRKKVAKRKVSKVKLF